MTTKPTPDFKGHPVEVGDTVIFTGAATFDAERSGLREGILIRVVYNFFDPNGEHTDPIYQILDLGAPNAKPATCGPQDIMYINSDYQDMSIDYIRSLHQAAAK